MRIIIMTCLRRGAASVCLPELVGSDDIDVAKVILVSGPPVSKKKTMKRNLNKVFRIGLLGALNGIRMRKWYVREDLQNIEEVCRQMGVPCQKSPAINSDETRELFREADADLGLSLGNGYIGKSVFSIPRHGMINLHMELLPKYQGAASVIWPIYEGDTKSGMTIHQIDAHIDTGDILHQEEYPIAFQPTLEGTVRKTLEVVRVGVPKAMRYVVENYVQLKGRANPQGKGTSYTTPTIWQFRRMVKNNRRLCK